MCVCVCVFRGSVSNLGPGGNSVVKRETMSQQGTDQSDDRMSLDETGPDVPPSYGEATGETASPTPAAPAAAAVAADEKTGLLGDDDDDAAVENGGRTARGGPAARGEESSGLAGPSSPPGYAKHDPSDRTYLLRPPLVYSSTSAAAAATGSSGAQTPAYQLSESRTSSSSSSSGRPSQLGIRPLQPSESMRLSLKGLVGENALGHRTPTVRYDEDTALYSIVSGYYSWLSPRCYDYLGISLLRLIHIAAEYVNVQQSAVRDPEREGRGRRQDTSRPRAVRGAGVLADGAPGRDQGQRQRAVLAHDEEGDRDTDRRTRTRTRLAARQGVGPAAAVQRGEEGVPWGLEGREVLRVEGPGGEAARRRGQGRRRAGADGGAARRGPGWGREGPGGEAGCEGGSSDVLGRQGLGFGEAGVGAAVGAWLEFLRSRCGR